MTLKTKLAPAERVRLVWFLILLLLGLKNMIHFRNRAGFTMIEVLFAIAIISMAIAPLLILQGQNIYSVKRASGLYTRFSAAYAFLLGNILPIEDRREEYAVTRIHCSCRL